MFWLIGVLRPGIGAKCASMLTTVWLIDASCRSETAGPEDLSPSHTAAVEERGWLVRYIMCILFFFCHIPALLSWAVSPTELFVLIIASSTSFHVIFCDVSYSHLSAGLLSWCDRKAWTEFRLFFFLLRESHIFQKQLSTNSCSGVDSSHMTWTRVRV